jgi:hypothetical protein
MISLGIKCGREFEHVRGTKLHAKPAGLTTLHHHRNASFSRHRIPQKKSEIALR